jgi:hypothetical protein
MKIWLHRDDFLDRPRVFNYCARAMTAEDLDTLRLAYKSAVDEWVKTIRAEEALATTDHSMTAWEKWDSAHFSEQDSQAKADAAREAYKDALRAVHYDI